MKNDRAISLLIATGRVEDPSLPEAQRKKDQELRKKFHSDVKALLEGYRRFRRIYDGLVEDLKLMAKINDLSDLPQKLQLMSVIEDRQTKIVARKLGQMQRASLDIEAVLSLLDDAIASLEKEADKGRIYAKILRYMYTDDLSLIAPRTLKSAVEALELEVSYSTSKRYLNSACQYVSARVFGLSDDLVKRVLDLCYL